MTGATPKAFGVFFFKDDSLSPPYLLYTLYP